MKKKIAMMLLVTVMTASIFTGCGNSAEGDGKVQAAIADAGNSQEDSGGAAEGTEAGEPALEETAEPTAQPTPEAMAEPSAQPTPEATVEPTAQPAPEVTEEPVAKPTEEPASTEEPEKDTESGTAADSFQGAANNSVSSQTSQQGSNQSFQQTGTNQANQTNTTNGTAASVNDTAVSSVPDWFDPVFYATEYPDVVAVMGADADVLYQHYLNCGRAEGRKSSANSNAAGTEAPSPTASNYLSQAFVNYLNQQRSAQGLGQVSWNSDFESYALTRSQQLASDFSHNNMTMAEIILATPSNDPASWYESFAESYGHNLEITDPLLQSGAAAVYQEGEWYYVIFAYTKSNPTGEEIIENINNSDEAVYSSNTYIDANGEEKPTASASGGHISSSEEEAREYADQNYTPEQIEWLKSIGAY